MKRRLKRWIAILLLAATGFAQAAVAMASCEMADRSPTQAISGDTAPPCHEEPSRNGNLCLAHCLSADQRADTPQVFVPVSNSSMRVSMLVADRRGGVIPIPIYLRPPPPSRPPRILFQSFLI